MVFGKSCLRRCFEGRLFRMCSMAAVHRKLWQAGSGNARSGLHGTFEGILDIPISDLENKRTQFKKPIHDISNPYRLKEFWSIYILYSIYRHVLGAVLHSARQRKKCDKLVWQDLSKVLEWACSKYMEALPRHNMLRRPCIKKWSCSSQASLAPGQLFYAQHTSS